MLTTDKKPTERPHGPMLAHLLTVFKIAAIAAKAVVIGALGYAIWRIEHWRKTFESLLSEVDEQFKPPAL